MANPSAACKSAGTASADDNPSLATDLHANHPQVPRKKTVLFVGAFSLPRAGGTGGQYAACRQLLDSPASQAVHWRLVDASMISLPPPGWITRTRLALARVVEVFWKLLVHRVDTVFVFASFTYVRVLDKALACFLGRLFGKRVVLSFRSEIHPPAYWPRLGRAFLRLILRSCDAVLCQSQIAADGLHKLFGAPREKLIVVPNWIDIQPYEAVAARRAVRPTGDPPVILFVGWVVSVKGVFVLADAVAKLRAAGRRLRLVYCGAGAASQELSRRCAELGISDIVEERGWVHGEQKLAAYEEADFFVLPTWHKEGMPNALIEAMACGLPSVATPVGGIPSLVTHGENGYLVEPRNVEQLADAIADLIDNPSRAARMGAASRTRILRDHDIAMLSPRLIEILISKTKAC